MTKKDYIKLAKLVYGQTSVTESNRITRDTFIVALCDILKEDNPRFDRVRFLTACDSSSMKKEV